MGDLRSWILEPVLTELHAIRQQLSDNAALKEQLDAANADAAEAVEALSKLGQPPTV